MNWQTGGRQANSADATDSIGRILSSEEQILPSSGFLAAVMERVEEESRAPAPIPFPWKRALLAIPLVIGVVGLSVREFVRYGIPSMRSAVLPQIHLPVAPHTLLDQAVWVAVALVVSFLSWKLARRITGQT